MCSQVLLYFCYAGKGDCCIAHRVFCGILRSDVMCTACGFTSATYEPCVDISLDLEPNQVASTKKSSTKSLHSCSGEADSKCSSQTCGISTLMGCLDRFTRPERLGSEIFCQRCQVKQESLKQMSIRKLASISYRAIQELLEADKGGNKWETLERCVQTQRNPKQMVVGICQEKIHERHRSLRSL